MAAMSTVAAVTEDMHQRAEQQQQVRPAAEHMRPVLTQQIKRGNRRQHDDDHAGCGAPERRRFLFTWLRSVQFVMVHDKLLDYQIVKRLCQASQRIGRDRLCYAEIGDLFEDAEIVAEPAQRIAVFLQQLEWNVSKREARFGIA